MSLLARFEGLPQNSHVSHYDAVMQLPIAKVGALLLGMPLKIKHVGFADVKRLVEIEVAAFESLEVFPFLCPDGVGGPRREAMRAGIKGVIINDSTAKYMKVINTEEQDKIVAFAKWHMPVPLQPTITSPVADKLTTKDQLTPATLTNRIAALAKLLSSQSSNSGRRIMGNELHCFLDRLVTDPLSTSRRSRHLTPLDV